jgi:hypothetical protein
VSALATIDAIKKKYYSLDIYFVVIIISTFRFILWVFSESEGLDS